MEFSFFQSLLFGFLSGLTDILPVSSQAHKTMLLTFFGTKSEPALLRLLVHIAVLGALYFCTRDHLKRLSRQIQLAKVPKRRRKRPLDTRVLMEVRLLKTMIVPIVICGVFSGAVAARMGGLQWIALMSLVNAAVLYLPGLVPTGNKDARSVSPLEGLTMGIGGGAGILPGVSSMAGMLSVASVSGMERKFALNLALFGQMAMTAVLTVFDLVALVTAAGAVSIGAVLGCILAAAAAFGGVWLGVRVLRALAERIGFGVFALYSVAVALLSFIFYLMV